MRKKLVILFSLSIIVCSCSKALYKEYSFKQKGVRELNFYFINDTLGCFKVKYLCTDTLINIEQKFIYKKTSDNKISIKGIEKQNIEPFIYVPLKKLNACIKSNKSISIEKIPTVNEEEILIYKRKLFWQKVDNNKVVSAFIFKVKN